ncbi:MAG: hypothetical protein AAFV53_41270 [Myxococcota bacterium]
MSAVKKHDSAPQTPSVSDRFVPDPELSERLARATAEGALDVAKQRISRLEEEVAQLRAEAQWRDAVWQEERMTLQKRLHHAEVIAARRQERIESLKSAQMDWKVEKQLFEEQVRHMTAIHHATEQEIAVLNTRLQERDMQLLETRGQMRQQQEQLLDQERLLGAMWQTLKEYRSLGPVGRMLQRPHLAIAQETDE